MGNEEEPHVILGRGVGKTTRPIDIEWRMQSLRGYGDNEEDTGKTQHSEGE